MTALRVLSAIMFFPRGGSSHVARALTRELRARGDEVTLISGSRSGAGPSTDAGDFYGEVQAVDFEPALQSKDPMRYEGPAGTAPMHPSYEDRPGAPDVVFTRLDDAEFELQVRAWERELTRGGAADADVLHLHHLTPINEAAVRVAPDVPVVGQLHGTELLMLEQIDAGPPAGWTHAERWAERLRRWAADCERLLVAPGGVDRAKGLLGVPGERIVPLPGGVDTELFSPRSVQRKKFWQRVLVESPRGWSPGGEPGSVSYAPADAAFLSGAATLLYVGRFTAVKRLDLLLSAFEEATRGGRSAGLVLVGGHHGEWEGEHPLELVGRLEVPHVYLAGWYDHSELPDFFRAADAIVLSSDREQFGQVLVEAMACELPAVATASIGPVSIVRDGETGWLVPPGEERALADALVEAIGDAPERSRRGKAAREAAVERFSWPAVVDRLEAVLAETAGTRRRASRPPRSAASEKCAPRSQASS